MEVNETVPADAAANKLPHIQISLTLTLSLSLSLSPTLASKMLMPKIECEWKKKIRV